MRAAKTQNQLMKRRTFLWLSAVSAASFYIPASGCRPRNTAANKALAQPLFLAQICDEKTIREIGTTYKKQTPAEAKDDRLASLIRTDGQAIPEATDSTKLHTLLNQKTEQDFETGRTVIVNGWVLSQTEARQCALLSSQA